MNATSQQVVDPDKAPLPVLGFFVSEFSVRNRGAALANVHSVTNSEGFVPSTDYFKKEVFSKDLSTYKIVRRGMLAYNPSRINVGSVAVQNRAEEVVVSPLYVVVSVDGTRLHPDYLSAFLHSPGALAQIRALTSGSVRDTLSFRSFAKLRLPVPSLEEQEAALHRLAGVRRLRDLREQQLLCLDNLAKSLFVEMFGDPIENSRGWPQKPLGALCSIVRGGSPRPIDKFLGGNIPWIKISDATSGDDTFLHSTRQFIVKEGASKSRLVKKGSLIFANCGVSLGFARIITFDGCIHDGWLALENIDSNIDKRFLLKSLNQLTDHFRLVAPSGTQPNLNTDIMKKHCQILPPMELQQEYIQDVEAIDKSKFAILRWLSYFDREAATKSARRGLSPAPWWDRD